MTSDLKRQIANALIVNKFDKEVAYSIAFENARIISNNNMNLENIFHLVKNSESWVLISTDGLMTFFIEIDKTPALVKARHYTKNSKGKLYIHSESGAVADQENFRVNRPTSGPQQELICNEQKKWILKNSATSNSLFFEDKHEALKKAKAWAKEKRSKLLVKNEFGKIEKSFSYEISVSKSNLE